MAHLAGMFGIVAANAEDAAHGKEAPLIGDGDDGLRGRVDYIVGHDGLS